MVSIIMAVGVTILHLFISIASTTTATSSSLFKDEWNVVPGGRGMVHRECAHYLPHSIGVKTQDDGSMVAHFADGSVQAIPKCPSHRQWNNQQADFKTAEYGHFNTTWIVSASQTFGNTTSKDMIGSLMANITVPAYPSTLEGLDDSLIFYWAGVGATDGDGDHEYSAALQWGPSINGGVPSLICGQVWTFCPWIFRSDGSVYVAHCFFDLKPGTNIMTYLKMRYAPADYNMYIYAILSLFPPQNMSVNAWTTAPRIMTRSTIGVRSLKVDGSMCKKFSTSNRLDFRQITILNYDGKPMVARYIRDARAPPICNHNIAQIDGNTVRITWGK